MLESHEREAARDLGDLWVRDADLFLDASASLKRKVGVDVARIDAVPTLEN